MTVKPSVVVSRSGKPPFSLVLASASRQRRTLLETIWPYAFQVAPQDIDETPLKGEKPADYVARVTLEKARVASIQHQTSVVLASDTCVAVGRRILRKAHDRAEASVQMDLLSGRRHRVLTGVAVMKPGQKQPLYRLAQVSVQVMRLSEQSKKTFLDSEQWKGVAVYRMQGVFGAFVKAVNGQPSAVTGLPLHDTACLLGLVS